MSLKPWRAIAKPHKDVLEGTFKGLINQKNGLFHDTPGALGISGLQPEYRFQIRQ